MTALSPITLALLALLAFVLGACIASFVNCASLRRQSGESVLKGRSHCPACGQVLGAGELVPIASWFALGKKCKHCGKPISGRYPATEAILGLAYAAAVLVHLGSIDPWAGLPGAVLAVCESFILYALLLYVSLVDIDTRTVPFACIVAMLVVHLAYIVIARPVLGIAEWWPLLRTSLIGGFGLLVPLAIIVLIADKAFGRESMGGGDLMLFFVGGFCFGWERGLFLVLFACIFGIIGALLTQRSHEDESLRKREIPFVPSIALACVITDLFGSAFVGLYLGLF